MRKVARQALIDSLQRAHRELGRTPAASDARRLPYCCDPSSYIKTFGSWQAAQQAAGLPVNTEGFRSYTDEELCEALREVGRRTGFVPTFAEIKKSSGVPDPTTYIRRFGNIRGALDAAGIKYSLVRMQLRVIIAWMIDRLTTSLSHTKEQWNRRNQ